MAVFRILLQISEFHDPKGKLFSRAEVCTLTCAVLVVVLLFRLAYNRLLSCTLMFHWEYLSLVIYLELVLEDCLGVCFHVMNMILPCLSAPPPPLLLPTVIFSEHKSLFLDPEFTFLQRLLLTARYAQHCWVEWFSITFFCNFHEMDELPPLF